MVTKSSVAGSAFKLLDYNETNTPETLSKAKIIYLTGYFVASSPEASLEICRYAAEKGKIVALSLSATYICQFHKTNLLQILQYVDYRRKLSKSCKSVLYFFELHKFFDDFCIFSETKIKC